MITLSVEIKFAFHRFGLPLPISISLIISLLQMSSENDRTMPSEVPTVQIKESRLVGVRIAAEPVGLLPHMLQCIPFCLPVRV